MTKTTPPVDLAEGAFYHRITTDWLDLVDLLGHSETDERIFQGRPADVLGTEGDPVASDFPLLTYFGVAGVEVTKGYGDVRIQCDLWVWPRGTGGGVDVLKDMDASLYGRVYQESWDHEGRRFHCRQTDWRQGVRTANGPLHRVREFMVGVS